MNPAYILTINIESGRMCYFSGSIRCYARVFSAILDHNVADIYVAYHVTVNCNILANEKSICGRKEKKQLVLFVWI